MYFTQKFRQAVENVKAFFKAAPTVIAEIKKDTEKEILRQKFHDACDNVIETYGELIINVSKNVDIEKLASCAFDVLALVEKWRIPIQEEGQKIAECVKPVMYKFDKQNIILGNGIDKILKNMEKRNNWKERFTPDCEKLSSVEFRKSCDKYKPTTEANDFSNDIDAKKGTVKISELKAALNKEVEEFYNRKEGETVNEYWLRCKSGIKKFKTDKSQFVVKTETK